MSSPCYLNKSRSAIRVLRSFLCLQEHFFKLSVKISTQDCVLECLRFLWGNKRDKNIILLDGKVKCKNVFFNLYHECRWSVLRNAFWGAYNLRGLRFTLGLTWFLFFYCHGGVFKKLYITLSYKLFLLYNALLCLFSSLSH